MTRHKPWAWVKVRQMIRKGWEVWEAPPLPLPRPGVLRRTVWARLRPESNELEVRYMAPDELEVADEVLRAVREEEGEGCDGPSS